MNVLRDAMAVDALDPCGVYFGTTGGQVYVSPDAGDHWQAIVRDLSAMLSVSVQTLPDMVADLDTHTVRVVLPYHLYTLARCSATEVALDFGGPVTLAAVLDAIEAAYPALVGAMRDRVTG